LDKRHACWYTGRERRPGRSGRRRRQEAAAAVRKRRPRAQTMISQIYEIQTPGEAGRCIELGVDHIGSVLLSESEWRQPLIREVVRLSEGSGTRNSLIPLFNSLDTLCLALDYYRPHFLHFCESLTDALGRPLDTGPVYELQAGLKSMFPGLGIIRSIPVPREGSDVKGFPTLHLAERLEPVSDYFLPDTWLGREPVEGYIGITGRTGHRGLLRSLVDRSRIPVILAGGLSPENVRGLLLDTRAAGADSCTGTNETGEHGRPVRFKKDFAKVRAFVKEVRRAAREAAAGGSRALPPGGSPPAPAPEGRGRGNRETD
jgi:phosphoribosylanthranilate isomerase